MLLLAAYAHAEDLYVSSNERSAAILLNGVDSGYRTPAMVPGVRPGEILVTVEGACSRGEAVVKVLPNITTRASLVATEQLGTITLIPSPIQSRLELDSVPYPGAPGVPYAVTCGSHSVLAALDGYVTAILTIDVGMGQDLTVPINMQKLGLGSLDLSVQPRTGALFLDGKPVGADAVSLPSVFQGVHTIAAELDGYQNAERTVVVEDDAALAFHFTLVRRSQKNATSTVMQIGGHTADVAGEADAAAEKAASEKAAEKVEAAEEAERLAEEARAAERSRTRAEGERTANERRAAEQRASQQAAADEAYDREEAEAKREAMERAAAREAAGRDDAEGTAEEADRREADRRAAQRSASPPQANGQVGKVIGGVSLLAAGVGAGTFGAIAYHQASRAYLTYNNKLEAAATNRQLQRNADDYYDETVVPRTNLFYGSAIGSGLFLAGGALVLVIDERMPAFAPTPGGGMLMWNRRF